LAYDKKVAEDAKAHEKTVALRNQREKCRDSVIKLPSKLLGARLGKHDQAPDVSVKAALAAAAEGTIVESKLGYTHDHDLDAICGPATNTSDVDPWLTFKPPEVAKLRWVNCTSTVSARYSGGLKLFDYSCRGQAMWFRVNGGLLGAITAEDYADAWGIRDRLSDYDIERQNELTRSLAVKATLTKLDARSAELTGPSGSKKL
jgi:hypothetical protein